MAPTETEEEVTPTPPTWRHVVVHFASQPLHVEGEAEEGIPPIVVFDPLISFKEKVTDDPRFVFLSKSDIGEVNAEAVQAKILELAETQAKKASEEKEHVEAEEGDPGEVPAEAPEAVDVPVAEAVAVACIDGVIVLEGFDEELHTLIQAEQMDFHALLPLDGVTLEEIPGEGEEEPTRAHREQEAQPAFVEALRLQIDASPPQHWARNIRIESLKNCQGCDDIVSSIWNKCIDLAERYQDFVSWKSGVKIRNVDEYFDCDTEWYDHLLRSVHPIAHDVPLMLYCLVEQVERNCKEIDNSEGLETYFEQARAIFTDEDGVTGPSEEVVDEETGTRIVSAHNLVAKKHTGRLLHDGITPIMPTVQACTKVVEHLRVPGYPLRTNFPPCLTEQERSAERHRIYPFLPSFGAMEIERELLLQQFDVVLAKMGVKVDARSIHEKISPEDLAQTITHACKEDPTMKIEYYPRHDALLLVTGVPVTAAGLATRWCARNVCDPSFNDIQSESALAGVDRDAELFNMNCGEFGYAQEIRKVLVGQDGSVWMESTMKRGEKESCHSRVFTKDFSFRFTEDRRWRRRIEQWVSEVREKEVTIEGEEPTEEENELLQAAHQAAEEEKASLNALQFGFLHGEIENGTRYVFSIPPLTTYDKDIALAPDLTVTFPTGQVIGAKSDECTLSVSWPQKIAQTVPAMGHPGLTCAGAALAHFVPGCDLTARWNA